VAFINHHHRPEHFQGVHEALLNGYACTRASIAQIVGFKIRVCIQKRIICGIIIGFGEETGITPCIPEYPQKFLVACSVGSSQTHKHNA